MTYVIQLIEAVRANPMFGVGIAVGVVVAIVLLNRKPRLQREADDRLASIRREKSDQYTKLRPPN